MHLTKWHDGRSSTRGDKEFWPHHARKFKAITGKDAYTEPPCQVAAMNEGDRTYTDREVTAMSDTRTRARGRKFHVHGRRGKASRIEVLW